MTKEKTRNFDTNLFLGDFKPSTGSSTARKSKYTLMGSLYCEPPPSLLLFLIFLFSPPPRSVQTLTRFPPHARTWMFATVSLIPIKRI